MPKVTNHPSKMETVITLRLDLDASFTYGETVAGEHAAVIDERDRVQAAVLELLSRDPALARRRPRLAKGHENSAFQPRTV